MVRQTKNFRKGGLAKKVLSAILAASMIMTSSTFAMAAPVDEPVPVVEEMTGAATTATVNKDNITVAAVDYTGEALEPEVTVEDSDGNLLVKGEDYQVTYSNNVNAAADSAENAPSVLVEFIGETYGELTSVTKTFTIEARDITGATVDADFEEAYVYDKTDKVPTINSVVVKDGEKEITVPADGYDIKEATNNFKDHGTKTVTLTGKGNFKGTVSVGTFEIQQKKFVADDVTVTVKPASYTGDADTTNVAVIIKENGTDKDITSDFTIEYQDAEGNWTDTPNPNIGTHTLRIDANGQGNYVAGDKVEASYEVVSDGTLAMAVDGVEITETYNGADQYDICKNALVAAVTTVVEGKDYKVVTEKSEWKNAGKYVFKLEGLNKLAEQTVEVPVTIEAKAMNTDAVTATSDIAVTATQGTHSNGKDYASVVLTVKDDSVVLKEDVDYTYEVVTDKTGKATDVVITGMGNYTTRIADAKVTTLKQSVTPSTKLDLNHPSITAAVKESHPFVAGGVTLKTTDIEVVEENGADSHVLTASDFYIKGHDNNFKAGEATVTIVGKGKYEGERKLTFKIDGISFADTFKATCSKDSFEYTGADQKDAVKSALEDAIEVQYKSTNATYNNWDITICDEDGEEAVKVQEVGTYTVKVASNDGKYEGTIDFEFQVIGVDVSKTAKVAAIEDQVYTGKEIEPAVKVTVKKADKDIVLEAGKDYTVAYEDNLNAGVAKAIITFTGEYSGTIEKTFNITQAQQEVTLDAAQVKGLENRTTMNKDCTMKLTYALEDATKQVTYTTSDPKVATVNNGVIRYQGVGKAIITVTVADSKNCKGTSLDVEVNVTKPGKPSFTPTGKTKGFIATSSTVRGAQGWQVQYSTNKALVNGNTKGSYTRTFSSVGAKLSRAMNKVSYSKATYYVRVRCYQTVNGKKVYSSWSNVKSVKTK